jgi:hypothetical protein
MQLATVGAVPTGAVTVACAVRGGGRYGDTKEAGQ